MFINKNEIFYIENNLNSNISLFLVIVYSFFINIYFANFGTFPIDTFCTSIAVIEF